MTPTQEQIDELVKAAQEAKNLIEQISVSSKESLQWISLDSALAPFVDPKTDDLVAMLRRVYPNDSERTELGKKAADLIEELQNPAWNR